MTDPLLTLSIEALTQLTNAGLVKRAQRELENAPPELERSADGALAARFPDGTQTRFAAGAGLREAHCSCAAALCRHRLIVVLAWQRAQSGGAAALAPLTTPGHCDDVRLRAWAGSAAWAQATRLCRAGLLVDLLPGPPPVARLPHTTVHFHGGDDPAAAQSDAQPADHRSAVVLGVWAFRLAQADGSQQVQLGGGRELAADLLSADCAALLASLFRHGLAAGSARHAPLLSAALDDAQRAGATWLWLALQALEQWLAAFEARSARFVPAEGLALLAEVVARCRAGRGGGALAGQHALGVGERLETPLSRVRLRSLGVRSSGDGEQRSARVALLDADSLTCSALTLGWDNGGLRGAASVQRASAIRAGGQTLDALAHGQLVTVSAHRQADGQLRLGAAHGGRTSLLPQSADWSDLPSGVVVRSISAWQAARAHLPPSLLRPRHALARFIVLEVQSLTDVAYDPATQTVHALLRDQEGQTLQLARSHASAAPGALDALARALTATRAPRWIAGTLSNGEAWARLEPWALSDGEHLTMPDLAPPDDTLHDLPLCALQVSRDPLQALLAEVAELLGQRLLAGAAGPRWRVQAERLVRRLQDSGCLATGAALHELLIAAATTAAENLAQTAGTLLLRLALAAEDQGGVS